MLTYFHIGLEPEAVALLNRLFAFVSKVPNNEGWQPQTPEELVSRLLTDILVEDADAHGERTAILH